LKKEEIYWLLGTIGFIIFLTLILFGVDGLKSDSLTDINVHDTYYVIESIHLFIPLVILVFFGIYLIRVLCCNFKNLTVNLIFIISDLALILVFTFIISLLNSMREIPGTIEYPPLSGIENITYDGNVWNNFYYALLSVQLILLLLLAFSGIKTGINYKQNQK